MKSKKLISFLCAAAMTVSSFAGLAVTASAASEPVWSWDGSSVITDALNKEVGVDANGKFMQITAENNTKTYSYDLPAAAQLSDDYVIEFDTAIHAGNGMGRLAQYTQIAFASAALGTTNQDKKTYGGDYAAAATAAMKDDNQDGLGMAAGGYGGNFNAAADAGAGYQSDVALSLTSRIELLNNWIVNYDGSTEPSIEDGDAQTDAETWYRVRAAVKNGQATITIKDAKGTEVYSGTKPATTSKITKLAVTTSRGDANFFSEKMPASGPARVLLSNIKVYSGIDSAPAMTTEGLRGEAKPITWGSPEEVAGAAPRLAAPSGTTGAENINFESDSTDTKIVIGDSDQTDPAPVTEATVADGKVKLTTGARKAGEAASYASIVNVTGGSKAVKLNGDRFATGGRTPMLHMVDGALSTTGTTVLGFSAYISKNATSGSPKLWLIDADSSGALTNSGKTGLNHTGVFGVLQTTAPTDATKYSSSYQRGIQITPDEWHTVVVTMDAPGENAKYRIFVDGQYMNGGSVEAAVTAPSVHYGGTAYYPDKLPVIAVENDKENSSYSTVLIDNIVKYTIDGVEEENLPTSYVPEAKVTIGDYNDQAKTVELTLTNTQDFVEENIAEATVTLIHAAYASGKLTSIKAYENAKIDVASGKGTVTFDAADTVTKGDKLMVWDSLKGMKPLGAVKEVTTGQDPTPTTKALSEDFDVKVTATTDTAPGTLTATLEKKATVASATAPTVTWSWTKSDTADGTYTAVTGGENGTLTNAVAGYYKAKATLAADTDTYKAGSLESTAGVQIKAGTTPPTPGKNVEYETFSTDAVPAAWKSASAKSGSNPSMKVADNRLEILGVGGNVDYYTRFSTIADAPEEFYVEFDYTTAATENENNKVNKFYLAASDDGDVTHNAVSSNAGVEIKSAIDLGMTDTTAIYHVKFHVTGNNGTALPKVAYSINGAAETNVDSFGWSPSSVTAKYNTFLFRPGNGLTDTIDNFIVYAPNDTKGTEPTRYTITNNVTDGCTVTPIPPSGVTEGTPIKVTTEKTVKATYGDDDQEVTIEGGKFLMPAGNVTIAEVTTPTPTTGTVTVTGDNVKSVTLTPKSTGEAIAISSDEFTTGKDVAAGTYTVTAEAANNYYIEKIDPADVTVTAGESTSITVTAQKSPVFGTAADAEATDSAVVTLSTKKTDFGSVTTRADLTGFGVYKVEEGKITGSSNNTTLQPATGTKGHWIPIAVKVPAANAATAKIKIYCPIPTGNSYDEINPADESKWTNLTENKPATNGVYGAIICMEKKGDGTSDLQQAPVYPRKKAWVRVALDGTNYSDPVEIDWTGVDLLGDPAAESSPSDDTSIKGSGASNVVGDTDNLNDGAKVQDLGSVSVTKTTAPQDAQQDGYIYYTADGNTKAAGTDSANYAAVTLVPPSTEAKGVAIKALTEAKNANTADFSDDDVKKIDSTKDVTAVLKLDGENKAYQIAFVTGNGVALASLSPESYQTIGDTMVIDFSKVNTQGANDPGTPTDAKGTINGTDGANEQAVFPSGLKYETSTDPGFVKKITVSGKYAKLYEANGRKGVCVGVVFTRSADNEKITHSYVSSTPLETAPTPENLGDGLQWSDHSVSDAQQQVYGYWPDMTSVSNGDKYIYLVVEKTGGTKKVFAYHVVLNVTQMDSEPTDVKSMADKVAPDASLGSFNADGGSSKASDYGTFDVDKETDGEAKFSGTANKIKVTAKNMEGYYVPVKLTIPEVNKSKASVKWVVKTDGSTPSDDDYKPYTPTTDITNTGRLDIMTKVYDKDGTKVNTVIYFKVDLDGADEFAYSETAYKFTFDDVKMAKAPATTIVNTGELTDGQVLIGLAADSETFGTDEVPGKDYGTYQLTEPTATGASITGTAYNHTFNGTPGLSYKDWYLPITFKGGDQATLTLESVTYEPAYSGDKPYPSGNNILTAERHEFTFGLCLRPVDTLFKGEADVASKTNTIQSIKFKADADGAGDNYSEVEYTLDLSKIALTYGVTTTFTQDQEETNHGYITIDNPHVKAGEQASVTVKAAEGYKIKSVTTSDPATTPTPSDSTTYTFEMPAQNVSVSATFEPDKNANILYEMDLSGMTKNGQVSYSVVQDDMEDKTTEDGITATETDRKLGDVPNFKDKTDKTEAGYEQLNGWGYRHFINTDMYDSGKGGWQGGRQSSVSVANTNNEITLYCPGNNYAEGILSFLPANADIEVPTDSAYIYSFILTERSNVQNKSARFHIGLTTNTDATAAVAPVTGAGDAKADVQMEAPWLGNKSATPKAVPVGMIVNPSDSSYKIIVDGEVKATGTWTGNAPTGIYIKGEPERGKSQDMHVGIKDLVLAKGEAQPVTLNYKEYNAEGNTAIDGKAATTIDWITNAPFVAPESVKATFEGTPEKTKRYTFKSAESIDEVSADTNSIDLVFDPHEYQTTTFSVTLNEEAGKQVVVPIVINGAPSAELSMGTEDKVENEPVEVTIASGTTGSGTAKLLQGSYTYSVNLEGYANIESEAVKVGENNEVSLTAEADPKFTAKVKTAPFATVKLTGTSTGGTEYKEEDGSAITAQADVSGIAELEGATAGEHFTLTITSNNKYLDDAGKTKSDVKISEDNKTNPVDATVDYKSDTYPNMIYGDNFNDWTEDFVLASNANQTAADGIWTFPTDNKWSVLVVRGKNHTMNPGPVNLNEEKLLDGSYLYSGMFNTNKATAKATFTEKQIDRIEFDTFVDCNCASASYNAGKTGYVDNFFFIGDTLVFQTDGSGKTTDTIKFKSEDQTLEGIYEKWVHVAITDINTGTAKVTITKYKDTPTEGLDEEAKLTANVAITPDSATSFSVSNQNNNGFENKITIDHSGFIFENLEVYSAGE